jgi:hypothetical protein
VRYVLEGSVQRMRVNVQLVEAETGAHLWADRFDKPVTELLDMQDEIVARIANELSAQIIRVEAHRAERRRRARTCSITGFAGTTGSTRASIRNRLRRRANASRARAIDPDGANAMLGLVFVDVISTRVHLLDRDSERLAAAEALTLRAFAAEPRNAVAHYCLGLILGPEAGFEAKEGLRLTPNLALRRYADGARSDNPIYLAQRTASANHRPRSGSRNSATRCSTRRAVEPLLGKLSQLTVNGGTPAARVRRKASTMNPGALLGASGRARSCAMSGWLSTNSQRAGSWQ